MFKNALDLRTQLFLLFLAFISVAVPAANLMAEPGSTFSLPSFAVEGILEHGLTLHRSTLQGKQTPWTPLDE